MSKISVTTVSNEEKKTHTIEIKDNEMRTFVENKFGITYVNKTLIIADNKTGKPVVQLDMKDRAALQITFNSDNLKKKTVQKPKLDKVQEGSGVTKPKNKLPGEAKPKE